MPRTSTVRRLPPDLREKIGQLLDQGRTLDEIKTALDSLGAEVSRSALGRYKQQVDKVGEKLRRSRQVAEALVAKLGDAPESKSLRLNVELMHGVLMDLAVNANAGEDGEEGGKPVVLEPMDAMLLSKALDHLGRASKADAELVAKIREQAEAAARKAAAETAVTAARKGGLSVESVDAIRREILGIK